MADLQAVKRRSLFHYLICHVLCLLWWRGWTSTFPPRLFDCAQLTLRNIRTIPMAAFIVEMSRFDIRPDKICKSSLQQRCMRSQITSLYQLLHMQQYKSLWRFQGEFHFVIRIFRHILFRYKEVYQWLHLPFISNRATQTDIQRRTRRDKVLPRLASFCSIFAVLCRTKNTRNNFFVLRSCWRSYWECFLSLTA